jgi:predicted aconitase with swiveling domain
MAMTFKGRVIVGGNISGESLVTRREYNFNILASYFKGIAAKSGICYDQNNKDLFGKNMEGKILCLPTTIGSTTGGMFLQCVASMGVSPIAMLYSEHIDPVSAAGIVMSEIWDGNKIITIDLLGREFLEYVQNEQKIEISDTGEVTIY